MVAVSARKRCMEIAQKNKSVLLGENYGKKFHIINIEHKEVKIVKNYLKLKYNYIAPRSFKDNLQEKMPH